jgi:hypothetical protein
LKRRALMNGMIVALGGVAMVFVASCSSSAAPATVDIPATTDMPATTATSTTAPPTDITRWVPAQDVRWQWVLDHTLDLDDADDMGTAWLADDGQSADAPSVFDIDGFATEARTVTALHDLGAKAICYIEVGGWEEYRDDSGEFPPAAMGEPVDGYPAERYLDIRSPEVLRIVLARIDMCAAKGFDAVEPDLDDTFSENTGFALTQQDSVDFNATLAAHAHELGMSIALKNGDEPAFAEAMQPLVDFALVEQCFEFDSCDSYASFTEAGKAVFEVEYNLEPEQFCPKARALSFSAVLHDPALAGGGTPCQ